MKKLLLSLLVAATLTGTVAMPVSAAEAGTNVSAFGTTDISNWQRLGGDADSEIYKGKIINSESGQEIVMQVNEDGSFVSMPFSLNTYSAKAKSTCRHPNWNQKKGTEAVYVRKEIVKKRDLCAYDVYKSTQECTSCHITSKMYVKIPVKKHTFNKKRMCIICNIKKG